MNIFISCVSKKQDHACKAEEMYISDLFSKSLNYAKTLQGHVRILSAKYGVLELSDIIDPYNLTLNDMKEVEKQQWAHKVIDQLKDKNIDFNEKTIFLVGSNYRKYLLQYFSNYEVPIQGLPIGKQLQWYKEHITQQPATSVNLTNRISLW